MSAPDDASALRLTGLTKRFGSKTAVDDVSLEVRRGELYALLGPNGAGKTTTLRMVAGLLTPDAGDAFVRGHSIRTEPTAAKQRRKDSPFPIWAFRVWERRRPI